MGECVCLGRKIEGQGGVERPLNQGYQIEQDNGNKISHFYMNESIKDKFLEFCQVFVLKKVI